MSIELPDPTKLVITIGVQQLMKDVGAPFMHTSDPLDKRVKDCFNIQPDEDLNGGNDKFFFSFKWQGAKLFAAANEVGGLTVMLPEEY